MKHQRGTDRAARTDIATVVEVLLANGPEDLQSRILTRIVDGISHIETDIGIDESRANNGNLEQSNTFGSRSTCNDTDDRAIFDDDEGVLDHSPISDVGLGSPDEHRVLFLCDHRLRTPEEQQ